MEDCSILKRSDQLTVTTVKFGNAYFLVTLHINLKQYDTVLYLRTIPLVNSTCTFSETLLNKTLLTADLKRRYKLEYFSNLKTKKDN